MRPRPDDCQYGVDRSRQKDTGAAVTIFPGQKESRQKRNTRLPPTGTACVGRRVAQKTIMPPRRKPNQKRKRKKKVKLIKPSDTRSERSFTRSSKSGGVRRGGSLLLQPTARTTDPLQAWCVPKMTHPGIDRRFPGFVWTGRFTRTFQQVRAPTSLSYRGSNSEIFSGRFQPRGAEDGVEGGLEVAALAGR